MKQMPICIIIIAIAIPCSAQWKNASFGGQVIAFGVHDTTLFVAGVDNSGGGSYVYRFIPPTSWAKSESGLDFTQGNVTSFASLGTYFFAGFTHTTNGTVGPMYESTNNGANWLDIQAAAPPFTNGRYLFGNGLSSAYRSRDTGANWEVIACPEALSYAAIGICIFANTGSEVLRSYDTGNTWSQIPPPFIGAMTVMNSMLFIVGNGTLAESTDSGTQWITVAVDSAGTQETVNCLATDGKNLFAGTQRGVLVSTDIGTTWHAKNDSLYSLYGAISPAVTQMIVLDTSLFIEVTYGTGKYYVFDRPISELTAPDSPASVVQLPSASDTLEIYPNPATGLVTIDAGSTRILKIIVLNLLGMDLLDISQPSNASFTFDLSTFAAGTYFLQIQTASGIALKKIVIDK